MHNDINILDHYTLLNDFLDDMSPPCNCNINSHKYNTAYYFCVQIYSNYGSIIWAIWSPEGDAHGHFMLKHEAQRK